jgi:hypothetical protein
MLVEDVLDGDRALRAAEAAEGGVALGVGLARVAVHGHVGQPVGVVEVAQRAVITGPERSAEWPARETIVTSAPRMRPASSKPTSYSYRSRGAGR